MTETAALADYVLPAASFLERTELHGHAKYQIVSLTRTVVSWPGVQGEYDFWHDLALRLGVGEFFPWEDETALNRWLLEPTGLTLEELLAHPEGVEYSPARPRLWQADGLRDAVGQGRVRLGVPQGPGARRAPGLPQAGLPGGVRPRVPVRAHHRGAQAALPS